MCERYTSSQASLRGPPPPPLPLPLPPLPSRPRHFVRFLHTKPCWKTEKGRRRKLFKAIFFSPFPSPLWVWLVFTCSSQFFRWTTRSAAHTETDFSSPKRGRGFFAQTRFLATTSATTPTLKPMRGHEKKGAAREEKIAGSLPGVLGSGGRGEGRTTSAIAGA